jgi:hypothetical protein
VDETQDQLTNNSTKVKGKEPEGRDTFLRGESEHPSSSTPPHISGEFVPNAVVESKETAESYTSGNWEFNTLSVESSLRPSLVAPAPAHVPVDTDNMDVDPEPVAPTSRKRPSTLGRPPRKRTLLASIQAYLSQPTSSRNKHQADTIARKNDVAPQYLSHPSRDRDARDDNGSGDGTPIPLSHLSSLPTNASPAPLSPLGLRSDALMPLGKECTSAVGHQHERNRSLLADFIAKGTDEENISAGGKTIACPCGTPGGGTDKYRNKSKEEQHTNTLPSPIASPRTVGAHPASSSGLPPNPNPISTPHYSNRVDIILDVAEHIRRGNRELATHEYRNRDAAPSARTSTDMRAVLLQRLEGEQQLAQRYVTTPSSHSASLTVDPALTSSSGDEEASALEMRLRTRALLRVRLAAIKSSSNTTLIQL